MSSQGNEQFPRQTFVVIKNNKCSNNILSYEIWNVRRKTMKNIWNETESFSMKRNSKRKINSLFLPFHAKMIHAFVSFCLLLSFCFLRFCIVCMSLTVMCAINEWVWELKENFFFYDCGWNFHSFFLLLCMNKMRKFIFDFLWCFQQRIFRCFTLSFIP